MTEFQWHSFKDQFAIRNEHTIFLVTNVGVVSIKEAINGSDKADVNIKALQTLTSKAGKLEAVKINSK
jgi:hypothetical protein